MPRFGNPVNGYIRPDKVSDGTFHVTATFAEHIAGKRGPGIDLGNAKCGDPIYAMDSGKVTFSGFIGPAKVVRVAHEGGYESGYAHLSLILVKKGQIVAKGQQVGNLGSTGASACHLHFGMKLNGVEVDAWPLLAQNQAKEEDSMNPIPGSKFTALKNKSTTITNAAGANFRADRDTKASILMVYPVNLAFTPLVQAEDGTAAGGPTPTRWFGGFSGLADGSVTFGWVHSSTVGPLEDEAKAYSEDQIDSAKVTSRLQALDDARAALNAVK